MVIASKSMLPSSRAANDTRARHRPGKAITLMITDAIRTAPTKPILYFLLTSYVETLAFAEGVPEKAKRLPISGRADVKRRSHVMRHALQAPVRDEQAAPAIEEAADVFDVASETLKKL